jgi:hypothetical protein
MKGQLLCAAVVMLLASCAPARTPLPSRVPTPASRATAYPVATALPTQPPTHVPSPTPRPSLTPTLSPTSLGPFDLDRAVDWLYPEPGPAPITALPTVIVPSWLALEDGEAAAMAEVAASYDRLVHPQGKLRDIFVENAVSIIQETEGFLQRYPDGDGAIPALIMLGRVHDAAYGSGLFSQEEIGQEYEAAARLLLARHPERLYRVLHDLDSLGLPIVEPQFIRLGKEGPEVLLFAYSTYLWYGESVGKIYTLVEQPDGSWAFFPLPTHYIPGWPYSSSIAAIADVNGDGESEVVAELHHSYADGLGLVLNIFAWQDGELKPSAGGPSEIGKELYRGTRRHSSSFRLS